MVPRTLLNVTQPRMLGRGSETARTVRCVESTLRARVLAAQHSASAAALRPWESPDPFQHGLTPAGALTGRAKACFPGSRGCQSSHGAH